MKLNFSKIPGEFFEGAARLDSLLDFEISKDGTELSAVKSDYLGASLKDGKGIIYYKEKAHFFRALGLFIERARIENEFSVTEELRFTTVGLMLDASRGGVMTVTSLKKYMDYLSVMGYNMLMLYTEDTFTIENRPFFGYMRGRYAYEELKSLDDYAYGYGIELIPCVQTYGHLEKYLMWQEAAAVKDTATVLLAGEKETYRLIDDIIRCASAPFRSKRIHIGMDEAWDMGRGMYLDLNGYEGSAEIFSRHIKEVIKITDRYGLTPLMWSDMYFRIANGNHEYYKKDATFPEKLKKEIPKNIQLVYWHYGEGTPDCDDYMLPQHKMLNRDVIFAGGIWSNNTFFNESNYAFECALRAVNACKKHGVRDMMTTLWADDGHEVNPFSCLLALSHTAELAYSGNTGRSYLKSRFETCTKGNYAAFWDMSQFNNIIDGREYAEWRERFMGKAFFWQDVLAGLFDFYLFKKPMSAHYKNYAAKFKKYKGEFSWLYEYAALVFGYMETKTYIAQILKPAYDAGDRETLAQIAQKHLPALIKKVRALHKRHREIWQSTFKASGWANIEIRYAGVAARAETAIERLKDYLSGKTQTIEELDAERLPQPFTPFLTYTRAATV